MLIKTKGNILEMVLNKGEKVLARHSNIAWESEEFAIHTDLFAEYATYRACQGGAMLAFATELTGGIVAINLEEGETIMCHHGAVVAAVMSVNHELPDVDINCYDGMALQCWNGPGTIYVQYAGTLETLELAWGQMFKIIPELLVTCDITADIKMCTEPNTSPYDPEPVTIAYVRGPGLVRVQSNALSRVANAAAAISPVPHSPVD